MEEQKENGLEIEALKQEIEQLKLLNINVMQYESWNNQQIITWMMSLEHGRFRKYENVLSKALSEEDVKGIDLKDVDILDIKGWNIVNFGDRKALYKHIQRLINNNDNDDDKPAAIANEEGAESSGHFK